MPLFQKAPRVSADVRQEFLSQAALQAKAEVDRRLAEDPDFIDGFIEALVFGEIGNYPMGYADASPIKALSPSAEELAEVVYLGARAYYFTFVAGVLNAPGVKDSIEELETAKTLAEQLFGETMDAATRRTVAVGAWFGARAQGLRVEDLIGR